MEAKWLQLAESPAQRERTTTLLESIQRVATEAGNTMAHRKKLQSAAPPSMLSGKDREMAERHLLQAEAALIAGERHIGRQKEIVRDMELKGQDVTLAKELLVTFLALQEEHVAHRDRLKDELGVEG